MNRLPVASLIVVAGCASHGEHHGEHHHAHGEGMPHRFEDAEKWAKMFDDPARDEWQKPTEVIAAIGAREGQTIVDLGAGTGYFLRHLSSAVGATGKVIALDVEADMVRHMKARITRELLSNVEARQVPFDDPALEPASTDHILIVDTWHHISDRVVYSKKLSAALKPGGTVYIVDFTIDSERGPPKEHRLTHESVKELEEAGLTTRLLEESLPDQYIVAGVK